MSRKLGVALPAAVAFLALAAPTAGAKEQTEIVPGVGAVTVSDTTPDAITFTITPQPGASSPQRFLFVDADGPEEAKSTLALVWGASAGQAWLTQSSATDCQQYAGTDAKPAGDVKFSAAAKGKATFSVPKTQFADATDFRWSGFGEALTADNTCGASDNSLAGVATDMGANGYDFIAPPLAPTGLAAVAGDGRVELQWTEMRGVSGYQVIVNGVAQPLTAEHEYTLTGLSNGKTYALQVKAYRDRNGERLFSNASAAVSATLLAPTPDNPHADPNPTEPDDNPHGDPSPSEPDDNPHGDPDVSEPDDNPHADRTRIPPTTTKPPTTTVPPKNAKHDPDGDGIRNDWLVRGHAQAAPRRPDLTRVRAHSVGLQLPKVAKSIRLRVFTRVAGAHRFKLVATTRARSITLAHLKSATRYELKLVAVNTAGKHSRATKTLKVKTKRR